MTLVGLAFTIATVVTLFTRRSNIVWVLSATVPFSTNSAINIAGNSFPPYYLVGLVVTVLIPLTPTTLRIVGDARKLLRRLAMFVTVALLTTAGGPWVFKGIPVLLGREGIDRQILSPGELRYSVSNFAQTFYLLINVGVVYFVATRVRPPRTTLSAAFFIGTGLSSARGVLGTVVPATLFDNYSGLSYADGTVDGVERARGIFSEPSYLAGFSLAAVAYFAAMMTNESDERRRRTYGIGAALGLANLVASRSGTAALGALILAAAAGYRWLMGAFQGRRIAAPITLASAFVALATVLVLLPDAAASIVQLVYEKRGSTSFTNRSDADSFSLNVLRDSWGVGSGLGSNRPSSMAAMLLSCVGIVGTALFLWFFMSLVRRAGHVAQWSGTVWALVAILVAKTLAEPALSTPLMWMSVALCVHAVAAMSSADAAITTRDRLHSLPHPYPRLNGAATSWRRDSDSRF